MQSPDLAIQIVNYQSKAFLEPLLSSIIADISALDCVVEINILDNASGDDLSDIGAVWEKHNVHIYTSETNGGFGAGHNLLARETKAPYLLILNPDTLLIEPNTIQRLLASINETKAVTVGPQLLTPKSRQHKPGQQLKPAQLKQQLWDYGKYKMLWRYKVLHERQEVEWVSGGVMLLDHAAFTKINGFDEQYFLYYEDIDLCERLHKKGGVIMYDPQIRVLHYGSASTKNNGKYRNLLGSFFQYHGNRRQVSKNS
jgi:GT2 family glycosyltransferase